MKWLFTLILVTLVAGCAAKSPQDFTSDKALYEHAEGLYKARNYADAIPFYESLRNRFSQSPYAIPSELKIADALFAKEDFLEAEVNYQSFRALHPTHKEIPYVVYRIGMCHFEEIPGSPDRDQSKTEKALHVFNELLLRWPNSEYATKAKPLIEKTKRKLEEHELYVANFYLKRDEYAAAIGRLENLGKKSEFPDVRSEALYKLGYAYAELKKPEKALPYLNQAAMAPQAGKYAKKAKRLAKKLQTQ